MSCSSIIGGEAIAQACPEKALVADLLRVRLAFTGTIPHGPLCLTKESLPSKSFLLHFRG